MYSLSKVWVTVLAFYNKYGNVEVSLEVNYDVLQIKYNIVICFVLLINQVCRPTPTPDF